jgi:hypothetical protein
MKRELLGPDGYVVWVSLRTVAEWTLVVDINNNVIKVTPSVNPRSSPLSGRRSAGTPHGNREQGAW